MPRPPLGNKAMTNAERQRKWRERQERGQPAVSDRRARAALLAEVRAEVAAEFYVYMQRWKERVTHADRILAAYKGVISRADFRKIKACLHPDHNTFAHAAEALQIFSELEQVLVKPEAPVMSGAALLPASVGEMMARRKRPRR
jgi:hypothetical protein